MKKLFSLFAAVLMAGSMMAEVKSDTIKWSAAVASANLVASYASPTNTDFVFNQVGGNSIDGNTFRFGTADDYDKYAFRFKAGGATNGTSRTFSLSIPEAGTLKIAARTASGSNENRTLTLKQGEQTLAAVGCPDDQSVAPATDGSGSVLSYIEVELEAGTVNIEVSGGINFYAFILETEGEGESEALTLSMAKTEEAITITPSDLNAKYYVGVLDPSYQSWASYSAAQRLAFHANIAEEIESQAALEAKLVSGVQTITLADYTTEGYYQVVAGAMHFAGEVEGNINGFVIDSEVAAEDFTVEKQVAATTFSFADGEQGVVTITPSNNDQEYIYTYYNDNLKTLLRGMSEEDLIDFILGSSEDLSLVKGVQMVDIAEYTGLVEFGLSLPGGTYTLLVAAVVYDEVEEYYSVAGDIARHEDVVLEVEYPEFKGTPDFQKKGFSVKDIEEGEDYFVSYMLDVESYEGYSAQYSDEDLLNLTTGLPDFDYIAYKTAGETVLYANYDYFIDAEATENADYVILIANADLFSTGMVSSKAVKYYVTLTPDGELVTVTTGINNAEVESLSKAIVNGELVIVKDGVRYNVLGARK